MRNKLQKVSLIVLLTLVLRCSVNPIILDPNYSQTIPENIGKSRILTNYKSLVIEINEDKSYTSTETVSQTIFSKQQNNYAVVHAYYDKMNKIKSMRAIIRDANGKIIQTLKPKDVIDEPSSGSSTLYADTRIRYADMSQNVFPYTIEYEIVQKGTSLLSLPSFIVNTDEDTVLQAKFVVRYPESNPIRYRLVNTELQPKQVKIANKTELTWEFSNPKNFEFVEYYKSAREQLTRIDLAATFINVEGFEGRIDNWKDFGLWYLKLLEGRDKVPFELGEKITELTMNMTSREEKVKAVYQFVQDQTRYVSIQLGIGGWQPFDADYVYKNKFGDCKALSNYTYALLKHIGIESYHALATRGVTRSGVSPDFPENAYNHEILVVPNGDDYLWLECTDQTIPFNHIGLDNQNRYVLLIKPNGGELIKTPSSTDIHNDTMTETHIELKQNGDSEIKHVEKHVGNNQDDYRYRLFKPTKKIAEDFVYRSFPISNAKIKSYNFDSIGNKEDTLQFQFDLDVRMYGSKSGSRLFIPLNSLNKWTAFLPDEEKRDKEVYLYNPIIDKSVTFYYLPEGFKAESMPESKEIQTEFGDYILTVERIDKTKLKIERRISINKTIIPSEKYSDLKAFLSNIKKGDSQKMILVKN